MFSLFVLTWRVKACSWELY